MAEHTWGQGGHLVAVDGVVEEEFLDLQGVGERMGTCPAVSCKIEGSDTSLLNVDREYQHVYKPW